MKVMKRKPNIRLVSLNPDITSALYFQPILEKESSACASYFNQMLRKPIVAATVAQSAPWIIQDLEPDPSFLENKSITPAGALSSMKTVRWRIVLRISPMPLTAL